MRRLLRIDWVRPAAAARRAAAAGPRRRWVLALLVLAVPVAVGLRMWKVAVKKARQEAEVAALVARLKAEAPPPPVWADPPGRPADSGPGPEPIDFARDIRPLLSDRCFACHGPDEAGRKAKLRLDTRAGATADRGGYAVVAPGNPDASELIARLVTADPDQKMPPPHFGKPLTAAETDRLRRWVAGGAAYTGHWAFANPTRPPVPDLPDRGWARNPVDRFVLARLWAAGMRPSPEADRPTLIRRVTFDLTGLPPTPEEIDAFLADTSPDAYEKVVDRLLASPRFGERMAADWLDAARFADTHGYHLDTLRDMTLWRDWVIRAFNANMPFDQFTVEQLAGDLLPNPTRDQRVATGFHRNHPMNNEGGSIGEEFRVLNVVDRVETTGAVWLGLTVGCARCHDHKYDPVAQKDYYRLFAFFNNVPEDGVIGADVKNAAPVVRFPTFRQLLRDAKLRLDVDALAARAADAAAADGEQAAWEDLAVRVARGWEVLRPTRLGAANGTALAAGPDGDVRASGPAPDQDTYTLDVAPTAPAVTALRLETLPDEALPKGRSGRAADGNFILTGVKVARVVAGVETPVKVRRFAAGVNQDRGPFPGSSVVGGGAGWSADPDGGKLQTAVIEFDEPVSPGGPLRVRLEFQSPHRAYTLGRFRLSATGLPVPPAAAPLPADVAAALGTPAGRRTPAARDLVAAHFRTQVSVTHRALADRRAELAALERAIPDAMVMAEMSPPRETFVLRRGQYDQPGEAVRPGVPAALPPLPKDAPADRLGLARWLVSADHPLTARVTVNRYWQMLFGAGLVRTPDDFGAQGDWPTHPELLDWLACEFRSPAADPAAGWDVKRLVRLLATSSTYRQSSRVTPEAAADPDNRLLGRAARHRLPAEAVRDQALAAAGLLNGAVGGKSVRPYQPAGLWEELSSRADSDTFSAQIYVQDTGPDLYRRTLYVFRKRTIPPPALSAFDSPGGEVCTVRRQRTNTPLQALVGLNDPAFVEAARKLAERMIREGGADPAARIGVGFRVCVGRWPTPHEVGVLDRLWRAEWERYKADPGAARRLLAVGESPADPAMDPCELAAWAMAAAALLNLDETLTRN